jgi:hypothetical protein
VSPGSPIINSPPKSPISGSTTLAVTVPGACTDSGSESLLKGQYAFSLSGFNSSGFLAVVGSITVDGSGHVTAGEADTNGVLGSLTSAIDTSTSSYSVGSNHLGCATIATSFGTFNTRLAVGSILSSVATEGRMVEWDAPTSSIYFAATGQLLQQNASSFSGGLNSGSYAFEESGVDSSNLRFGGVGVMSASGGSLTNGEFDGNDAGTISNITGMTGTYTSAGSNGRFTMTIAVPSVGTSHVTAYMVYSSHFLFMTTDAVASMGVLAGEMKQQSVPAGGFSNSSLIATSVFFVSGLSGGGKGDVVLGLFTPNGAGSVTLAGEEDDGGTMGAWGSFSCSYSVAANGRVTISGSSEDCSSNFASYLTAPNTGFLLVGEESPLNGNIELQTGGPFTDALLSGTLYFGDLEVVSYGVASAEQIGVGVFTLNGSGGWSSTSDYTATYGRQADKTQTGTVGTVNSNGTLSQAGVVTGIIISSTEFVLIDNVSDTYPILELFKQ